MGAVKTKEDIMRDHRRARTASVAVLAVASFVAVAGVFAPDVRAEGKWRVGAPIPEGANEVIGAAIEGQVYVYGGQDSANKPQGLFFRYDPAKNEWTKLQGNPAPVHHGAAAAIGRKFYVFGGFRLPDTGKVGWYPEDKAWVYDVDTAESPQRCLCGRQDLRHRRARRLVLFQRVVVEHLDERRL